jgi:glutamine synthetase
MAKPNRDRFGSSSHLHVSLHHLDGKNVFPGNDFKLNDNLSMSNDMSHFLGGLMKYSLDLFILFAPTINSYKRFKNFSWAPSNLDNWSVDNRTSPFRICGSGKSLRIEYRIPGGDTNQYLAYAGLIAAVIFFTYK